jgi:hypothetical protein
MQIYRIAQEEYRYEKREKRERLYIFVMKAYVVERLIHIDEISKKCFFHLPNIENIHHLLPDEAAPMLSSAIGSFQV